MWKALLRNLRNALLIACHLILFMPFALSWRSLTKTFYNTSKERYCIFNNHFPQIQSNWRENRLSHAKTCLKVIISRISSQGNRIGPICLSIWVCESYILHRLNSTGLRYAPLTCIVQSRPALHALCTMMQKGSYVHLAVWVCGSYIVHFNPS